MSFEFDPIKGTMYYTGPSVFEPMSGTEAQQTAWENKRVDAYNGSMMSFLRACLANNVSRANLRYLNYSEHQQPVGHRTV
ncbi:hypothetical protein IDJ75_16040 [Mucilaginibacter rigui]|uniref:Uncharacterized protein n=1 Tax=Mucilaginibacter rigui TaxID=534635 RepID=A0ABR7X9I8_9SPHI|nr:hypothetical protein [Mucilaginibacter rigui]MBD1386795.1 hypothetical protein [Mucilaginibacter rigui]